MNKTHRHLKKESVDLMNADGKSAPVNMKKEIKRRIQLASNKFIVYP